jgi:tRNA-dihydrouridine synthase A
MIAAAAPVPITVKCRIGVDDQDPQAVLPGFLETMIAAGARTVAIHARKAWLEGLSPKQNRELPPLDYPLVHAMKTRFPNLNIVVNGGIADLDAARGFLAAGLDGAMIGRAAYHGPGMLGAADRVIFGAATPDVPPEAAVRAMLPYIEAERRAGTRLNAVTRHMLGAFQGRRGARAWRRTLAEGAHKPGAGPELVRAALAHVAPEPAFSF